MIMKRQHKEDPEVKELFCNLMVVVINMNQPLVHVVWDCGQSTELCLESHCPLVFLC